MIAVSPFAPASRCPLLIAPDNQLEWSTRKPCIIPVSGKDTFHLTREGDKLTLMAHKYYKDFRLWWVIYDNNLSSMTGHPMEVPVGVSLRIPDFARVQVELTNGCS